MEDCIEDKLDARHFPFLGGRAQSSGYHAPTRYRKNFNWTEGNFFFVKTLSLKIFCFLENLSYRKIYRYKMRNVFIIFLIAKSKIIKFWFLIYTKNREIKCFVLNNLFRGFLNLLIDKKILKIIKNTIKFLGKLCSFKCLLPGWFNFNSTLKQKFIVKQQKMKIATN